MTYKTMTCEHFARIADTVCEIAHIYEEKARIWFDVETFYFDTTDKYSDKVHADRIG